MIAFRHDSLMGALQLQRIRTQTIVVDVKYRCPVHGHRVGTKWGGMELKQPNCTVPIGEDKLCWEPLERSERTEQVRTQEYHVDLDPDTSYYCCGGY